MSNPGLNIKNVFREKVERNLALTSDFKTIGPTRNAFRKDNTYVLSLLMFYDNINNMISKVLR